LKTLRVRAQDLAAAAAVDVVVDVQVAEAAEAQPTVISESSAEDQVVVVDTVADLEAPQHQLTAVDLADPLLQLPTVVELLHTAEDMVVVDMETHQVAAASLGGKLSHDALFLFGPLSTLVQFIDLGQRRQTDVGSVDTTSFFSTFILFGAILCFRVLHSCDTFQDFLVAAPSRRCWLLPPATACSGRVFDHRTAYDR
jgi:hypothetical protein